MKGEGILGYLKRGWEESRWRKVARFRLGGEIRESIDIGKRRRRGRYVGCVEKEKRHRNTYGRDVGNGKGEKGAGRRMWVGYWERRVRVRDG